MQPPATVRRCPPKKWGLPSSSSLRFLAFTMRSHCVTCSRWTAARFCWTGVQCAPQPACCRLVSRAQATLAGAFGRPHTLFAPRAPWLADLRNASSCRLLPALSGWDERFDPSALSELKRFAPEVDFVLLSHPDLAHVGALPYDVPHSAHCASICMLHRGLASARMSPAPAHNCPTALRLLTFGSKAQLEEH